MQDTELFNTELMDSTDDTEMDTTDTEDVTELPGDGQEVTSGADIEAAMYAAMDSYFAENVILVSDAGNMDSIHKKIEDFSLAEICLVLIFLILLGGSIFKLIGGRVWNKL